MKALRAAYALRALREQPLWRLLAADKAPLVVALLQGVFPDGARALPGSVLHERLARDIEQLRAAGESLPQAAPAYVSEWLAQGWLTRRFPPGASEEEYELSAESLSAVRFVTGLLKPRTAATESRLSTVIQQLSQLAADTETDAASRIEALRAERDRIDRDIADIERNGVRALPAERALERARDVIALAEELTSDFRSVRDQFDRLNRGLRQSLMEHDGHRGEVLEQIFAGVDLIAESDAGRTFNAFWRLLTDGEQAATLVEALDSVVARPFARALDPAERRFLLGLMSALLDEGGGVHDVLQSFARSLRSFVQSREFLEQRRLHALLGQATQAALAVKDTVRANRSVDYALMLTSSRIRSVSQWQMYDPAGRVADATMAPAEASEIGLDLVSALVRQSEIDFGTLRRNVLAVLQRQTQASIAQVLEAFPARQGLGSVVGYVALGALHGEVTRGSETIAWEGADSVARRAQVPAIYFTRERSNDLAR